ncbi:Nucleoside phosphatase GDA1/CD39 [Drechmeria coniospora]|uniref:Nucleoside phosphatase GDA1/CD39 n=1 Tax=Drechmeria coniospora TaxID=98403 RepID=A0A151GFM4_DRECN|nr:Nucleoside phosphatase GDA1/CD39 [Drechmeria coniospora]KYK55862.1 Nucleoside phosphatase GDA1/CD39 [Drechmeria coniospora]
MCKNCQYGVIFDAGSSGTRVYVYKWKLPDSSARHASKPDQHTLPRLKLKKQKKIHPGVSFYAEDVAAVGPDHLKSLIDLALKEVPTSKIPQTPVFLMATAGVRFLPQHQQTALLEVICRYLQVNTRFKLPHCKSHVQVISGETEGLYGWVAANYLLGGFDHPENHSHGKGHHTYGFLDMGGASAQIAFAPNSTEAERHANDLKLIRMRRLDGSSMVHRVFTATWLGFGANKARTRYVDSLKENYDVGSVDEIPDPCLPKGLRTTLGGEPRRRDKAAHDQVLVGTGIFEECLRKTQPLLRKDAPCDDHPCLLDGRHVPVIDFDVNHFIGVSEYWHATHGVFGNEHTAYDLATYQNTVMDFCSRDWTDIEGELGKRKQTLDKKLQDAREACFKASWLINVLHEGIGIPRVSLEGLPNPGINTTKDAAQKAKDRGFLDPFQPVDKIDGIEVSWTLGKMILYAAGQVSPQESPAQPVGFGSNVESGVPDDFEHAGSVPLSSTSGSDDEGEGFITYLLRGPERRRKLFGLIRRRRRPGTGRKPGRGMFSFASQLFGRNAATYQRVINEGDAAELELGLVDSDEHHQSDSSDSSRAGKGSGLSTLRLNVDRPDDLQPPPAMDRNGLVIRTESRERLAPTLQMLNAGRRSRTGSPTRQKCSLTPPIEH